MVLLQFYLTRVPRQVLRTLACQSPSAICVDRSLPVITEALPCLKRYIYAVSSAQMAGPRCTRRRGVGMLWRAPCY